MRNALLNRATRCPDCGKPVCTFAKKLVGGREYCPHCGFPCRISAIPYLLAVAGGCLAQYQAYRMGWKTIGRSEVLPFLAGFLLVHIVLEWIVPFLPDPKRQRTVWGSADVKKQVPYSADRVFHAACSYYQQAYGFTITGKDEAQRVLWVERERVKYLAEQYEQKWECFCISVTEAGAACAELRVGLEGPESRDYNQRQVESLNEVWTQIEKEIKE